MTLLNTSQGKGRVPNQGQGKLKVQDAGRPKPPGHTNKFTWLTKGTGQLIKLIDPTQTKGITTPVSSGAGFELLCTYNWISTPTPSIYVPGGPPRWKPVTLPTALPKDAGTHIIDQNAFRAPVFPFEPMFAALDLMKPDFDFGEVDVVTNRNSLRKLLNFASGRVQESFRIDVNMVHSTMFLTRRERNTTEKIQGPRNAGYGHNFERAFTEMEKGLEESSGHHRVIRYKMGELDFVVRFEVDAWCEDESKGEELDNDVGPVDEGGEPEWNNEDVLARLTKLSLDNSNAQKKKPAQNQYKPTWVVPRGHAVPSTTLAEIKAKKRIRLADALPQLWFGRTPLLLSAIHNEGNFMVPVHRVNVGEKFQEWEIQQQEVLQKMVGLIAELRDVVREQKAGTCVVLCENKARPLRLEVLESTTRKMVLPEEIVKRYWRDSELGHRMG